MSPNPKLICEWAWQEEEVVVILQEFQYGKETVQTTTRCLNESNILLTPAFMETGVFKHLGYGNIEW